MAVFADRACCGAICMASTRAADGADRHGVARQCGFVCVATHPAGGFGRAALSPVVMRGGTGRRSVGLCTWRPVFIGVPPGVESCRSAFGSTLNAHLHLYRSSIPKARFKRPRVSQTTRWSSPVLHLRKCCRVSTRAACNWRQAKHLRSPEARAPLLEERVHPPAPVRSRTGHARQGTHVV